MRDIAALVELRRAGQITIGGWLRSVTHRQTLQYFSLTDPIPSLRRAWSTLARVLPGRQSN